jgi:N-acetyl-gamma-glutamyl-phosphate reductase
MNVVVFGASGYAGGELLRLIDGHPEFTLLGASAESLAGARVEALYPMASPEMAAVSIWKADDLVAMMEQGMLGLIDIAFLALPHGVSEVLVPKLAALADHVIDLAADFRLGTSLEYEEWYGRPHGNVAYLERAVYGLPELDRAQLPGAPLVAVAGCYVTAATLAIAPLIDAGLAERVGVVVDAASGVSGAGRTLRAGSMYGAIAENLSAYGLFRHRHTVEMERNTGAQILFTPHLAPMFRGILATCYLRPTEELIQAVAHGEGTATLQRCFADRYRDEQFVRLTERPPDTKSVAHSNMVALWADSDPRTGWVVVIAALDNLTKGAAGQAVQCANIVVGLNEATGLGHEGNWI